jgi:glucose-6-phosphate isomerase/transaldolase/glucose-6-phosphate isomerase
MPDAKNSPELQQTLEELNRNRIVKRIFERDFTVWSGSPDEIANRLGWLDCPREMRKAVPELTEFAAAVRDEGIADVVLLGMGGSSLAAEVLQAICGNRPGYPAVQIVDTTDPLTISERQRRLSPERTLFIVATKSGGTVETISLFRFFYRWMAVELGQDKAPAGFVAITDPGSSLEATAKELGFRRIFLNDPDIGGRYSALSHFGLVPAALAGIDIGQLLDSAAAELKEADAALGAYIGGAAAGGRSKLTIVADKPLEPFGAWLEQLVAESSGKLGRGILPVTGEPWLTPGEYSGDRCFVVLKQSADSPAARQGELLAAAGLPVAALEFAGAEDLGAQFMKWELATAIACQIIGVNPFDQPDVEQAKVIAREAMDDYRNTGSLPGRKFTLSQDGVRVGGTTVSGAGLGEALRNHLSAVGPGGYICLQAFLPALPAVHTALEELAALLTRGAGVPAVWGIGPRYLHSTGQLHKGGFDGGLFIQITCEDKLNLDIPDDPLGTQSSATFGVLKQAQAAGDYHALERSGRRVLACHFDEHLVGLARLIAAARELPK